MTQEERRRFLIDHLLEERSQQIEVPADGASQKALLRALFNVREPSMPPSAFIDVQDAYLQEEIARKGITDYHSLTPAEPGIYLWRGDITTLRCGAIVNAANSQMLGCFVPNHSCIDNAIHTFAGVQLRFACAKYLHEENVREFPTGRALITPAFNLPADFVLHTVGPIVQTRVTPALERALASCYRSCLEVALAYNVRSVAFCCISTGVFRFPADRAARIAVRTVRTFQQEHPGTIDVIFNVFKESDYEIYQDCLGVNRRS